MRTAMVMILLGLLCLQGLLSEVEAQPAGSRNYFVKQDTILILATKRWVDSLVAAGVVVATPMTGDAILDSLNAENRTATNRWTFSDAGTFDDSVLIDNELILGDDTPEQDEPGTIIFWPTGVNRGVNDKVVFRARPYGNTTRYYYIPPTAGPDTLAVLSAVRTLITSGLTAATITGDKILDSLNLEDRIVTKVWSYRDTVEVEGPMILGDPNTEADQPGTLQLYPTGNRATNDIVMLLARPSGSAVRYYYLPPTTGPDTLAVLSAVRTLLGTAGTAVLGSGNGTTDRLAQWSDSTTLTTFDEMTWTKDEIRFTSQSTEPTAAYRLYLQNIDADEVYVEVGESGQLSFYDATTGVKTLASLAAGGTIDFGEITDADTTNKQEFTTFAYDEAYEVWRQRPMIPHTVEGMRYFLASEDADSAISLPDNYSLWQDEDTAKVNYLKVDSLLTFADGSTQTTAAGSSVSDEAYDYSSWNGVTTESPSKNAVRDKIADMISNIAYGVSWLNAMEAPTQGAVYDKIEALSIAGGADGQNADSIMDAPVDTLLHQARAGDIIQWDGSQWTIRSPLTYIDQVDEFMRFGSTSGQVGELGWSLGGTNAMQVNSYTAVEANHPGAVYLVSSANTGVHFSSLRNNASSTNSYPAWEWSMVKSITVVMRAASNSTDHKVRVGVMDDLADDTPDVGMYLERDAAETNWRFVSKATADSEVRTDLGIAYGTSWHTFEMRVDSDSLRCFVDGVQKANHALSKAPVASDDVEVGFVVNPTSAVAKGLYVDYWRHRLEVTR